jgi:hypothetical protein
MLKTPHTLLASYSGPTHANLYCRDGAGWRCIARDWCIESIHKAYANALENGKKAMDLRITEVGQVPA